MTDPNDPNKDNESVNKCYLYDKYYTLIEDKYKEYQTCKQNGGKSCYDNVNSATGYVDELKEFCSQSTGGRGLFIYDSATDQNIPDMCLQNCLKLNDNLNNLKKQYGIDVSPGLNECNFSARLIVWINNIVRWIKYILPVIVIILGILDFMKAVGSDKEDDMKKAQGKFMKRLIAAALVFIVPLILEFILTKMGFGYGTCGIKF